MSKALNAVKALVANWEKLKVARSSESDLSAFGIANLSFETLDRVFANWDLVIASLDDKNIWATSPELALADQPLSAALNDISGLLLNAAGNGIGWLVSTHFFTRALEIQTHITAIASRRIAITREVARVLEARAQRKPSKSLRQQRQQLRSPP